MKTCQLRSVKMATVSYECEFGTIFDKIDCIKIVVMSINNKNVYDYMMLMHGEQVPAFYSKVKLVF